MELTILLSKVFGIYLLVGGLTYMTRQKYFMAVVHDFVGDRALRMVISAAEIIAGLFLVLNHNLWDSWPQRIVSAVGWLVVLEGALYLVLPESTVKKILKLFNTKGWYVGGGVVSVLLGLYLVNYGFGLGLL